MTIKVRYLSEDEIERETELLLAEYEETAGERSGRIEARIGLRMMPTFPRSPLSFAE
jgi:hypothetical protein